MVGGGGWGGWEGAPRSCHAATFMLSSASLLKEIHMSTRVNASKAFFGVGGVMVEFFFSEITSSSAFTEAFYPPRFHEAFHSAKVT